ncbi:MAG: chemotaxis protein [Nitrosopumilus sp.]|uniref:chemotaxis protein n=1 Tax=Nitrosopumilus sp. TaxID=2024843 RepID=UPI00246C5FF6|nr:chemotaxis protein [Nitrosopumilus sp.]MDH5432055.1 chemotaxis protein [Nitrosopumilus sp.]MDH5698254.1 chemotaxis protein [Nitrosopumilus sp.]
MAAKSTKKESTVKAKKTTKKEPSPSILLKKVASVTDSNKALQKEIKVMTKIFGENQKVLVSMKGMIDALTSTLEHIQKQSKQINIIEDDTQKLYAGLNQVRMQSNLVNKINDQTLKLEEEISRISELQKASKSQELSQQVEDSMNSIKNNSQMIIKIAQRIDEVRDDLRKVSGKTDSFLEIGSEMDSLKKTIEEISGKTAKLDTGSQIIESLKQELGRISEGISSNSNLNADLDAIKVTIDAISAKASKIDSLGGVIDGLKQQFDTVSAKANSVDNLSLESIRGLGGKIDKIETEINSLSQRADSTAFVGEGLKSVQEEFSNFKQNVYDKTNSIEQKISSVSDTLKRQDESTIEFHKKSEKLFQEIQSVKNVTSKAASDSSKEMMALLKLSEYQSNIRMNAESKYGVAEDIEKMASQTADIVNLFDKLSIESGEKIPLPHEVRQWAVSKILDCADKWEVRFSDVYSILTNAIGRDMLKESIRIQQIRDIYGIRAVDEIRRDLNIP